MTVTVTVTTSLLVVILLLLVLIVPSSTSSSINSAYSQKVLSMPTIFNFYSGRQQENPLLMTLSRQRTSTTSPNVYSIPRGGSIEDDIISSGVDYERLIDGAYGWCCNLGAPSALVAGAVVASIYENMNNPNSDYHPEKGDKPMTGYIKKTVRWLLITAFACEAICIFVTTVTGTMLLSQDVDTMIHQGIIRTARTPLQFLHDHFEYEYLTGHIAFLQGLVHWFLAIALSHSVPGPDETETSPMNRFLATTLFTTVVFLVAVYNKHIYFYENYGSMLHRWLALIAGRFIVWPPRPLSFILFPAMLYCVYLGIQVFFYEDSKREKIQKISLVKTNSNPTRTSKSV